MEMALDLTGPGDLLSIGEILLRIKDFHMILFIDFDNTNIMLLLRFPGWGCTMFCGKLSGATVKQLRLN